VWSSFLFISLAGELLPGLDDPDAVVGKFVMCAGQFQLRHVAVGAFRLSDFADAWFCFAGGVARLTTRIIVLRNGIHFLMRIMAGNATDAGVFLVVAFTPG
jgi:hypothetical protein